MSRKSKIDPIVKVKIVEQELRDRIVELERKNIDLQMENDLLKKVRELERRDHYL